MTSRKDKQITLENLIALGIVVLFIIIVLIFGQYILGSKIVKLESKLQSCQEKLPISESVLFYRCEADLHLHNVLVDENNRSLYDYQIKKVCEIFP